ncbi:MAG: hypothetical protein HQL23_05875 [Candidatus Omnitrophica bacterium]|nr:hypothetical protein [Candidatus Omnitrophota bacterium]
MIKIGIREFLHHYKDYLQEVKSGEGITLMERNLPIVDIYKHNANIRVPGWKRDIKRVVLKKGLSLSRETILDREKERF